ncbi:MAG: T9SS type A sorting domain-containing protein [Bacteroidales bacterium]|nr:T9SS type A sorting domain-containing protein [Bacteroidales bacterium]
MSFFPNPAKNSLQISVLTQSEIEIINVNGQVVYSDFLNELYATIDISMLSSGLYLIKASSENNVIVEKLIIE